MVSRCTTIVAPFAPHGVSVMIESSAAKSYALAGAAQPIEVDTRWTIDLATGLLAEERRQSFLAAGNAADRKLVEERIRALEPGDPD